MDYEGQICRAPSEKASFMLPVMVGCTYNRCRFCTLFRHLKYRVLPLDQVEAELKRVRDAGGVPRSVFLGDGNAFDLPTSHLLSILDMIRSYFPSCTAVNMDATVGSILAKSDEELRLLARAGVSRLYLGIECGLPDVLEFMHKGHDPAQARTAIERIKRAGMVFCAHIMTGIAGKGRGEENARALAAFFNETKPAYVVNFSLFLHGDAPLYGDIRAGAWEPASELENLREDRLLLQELDFERDGGWTLVYDGFHDFVRTLVHGRLPHDRGKMFVKLDAAIAAAEAEPEQYSFVCYACGEYSTLEDVHLYVDECELHQV